MPFCCFEEFLVKFTDNFTFYSEKVTILRNGYWKTQKVGFSYHVWKGEIPVENMNFSKQLFLIKPVKGDKILPKVTQS